MKGIHAKTDKIKPTNGTKKAMTALTIPAAKYKKLNNVKTAAKNIFLGKDNMRRDAFYRGSGCFSGKQAKKLHKKKHV